MSHTPINNPNPLPIEKPLDVNSSNLANLFGIIGLVLYFAIIFTPIKNFIDDFKNKRKEITQKYETFTFVLASIQGALLFCFGLRKHYTLVTIAFIIGFLLNLAYLNVLLFIEEQSTKPLIKYSGIIGGIWLVVFLFFPAGLIGVFILVFFAGSIYFCLQRISKELSSKNSDTLTVLLVNGYFFCYLAWIIFGFCKKDYFIAFGFIIGLVQCILNMIVFYWTKGTLSDENFAIVLLKKYLKKDERMENNDEHMNHTSAKLTLLTGKDFS